MSCSTCIFNLLNMICFTYMNANLALLFYLVQVYCVNQQRTSCCTLIIIIIIPMCLHMSRSTQTFTYLSTQFIIYICLDLTQVATGVNSYRYQHKHGKIRTK